MSKLVEEWRPVVGYEGLYEVSDWGRVRSLDRIVNGKNQWAKVVYKTLRKGKILTPIIINGQYHLVRLCVNKKQTPKLVHVLVAEAFIPNPENKPEVDHIIPITNGGTNEVWNLRWVTKEENFLNPLTKQNHSEAAKRNWINRKENGWVLPEEARKKISIARKKK